VEEDPHDRKVGELDWPDIVSILMLFVAALLFVGPIVFSMSWVEMVAGALMGVFPPAVISIALARRRTVRILAVIFVLCAFGWTAFWFWPR
jgi:hypothetical protein